jgi:hypothetical protein
MPDYGNKVNSPIYIRGIGSKFNTPSVAFYVDNVPYFDKSTLLLLPPMLLDVQRWKLSSSGAGEAGHFTQSSMSEYTLKSARHNAPTIVIEGEYQVLG